MDKAGSTIQGVNIRTAEGAGTFSDDQGNFLLSIKNKSKVVLTFSHINYQSETDTLALNFDVHELQIVLEEKTTILQEVSVVTQEEREQVSITRLKAKEFKEFPAPFDDISQVLVSLPGVISNNELSSSYSVRGGNFDENLVYVADIPIYRPQISSNGQQEGLGFVNTSMVQEINFSAGGWRSSYGDKLASVLVVDYLEPQEFMAKASLGLLGGSLTVGNKIGKTSFIAGVRHKNSRYLLNTLETEGEYFPQFTDVQFYSTTNLSKNTSLMFLGGYAKNRYEVFPASRETEFGTFNISYRLNVALVGKDLLEYDTYQGGVKLSHQWNSSLSSSLLASVVRTSEREYTEVEGGYRLCDVNKDIGSPGFNECLVIRGIGTLYDHRRNYLRGEQYLLEGQTELELTNRSSIKGGAGWSMEDFTDRVAEFNFVDSAGFVTDVNGLSANNELKRSRAHGYLQYDYDSRKHHVNAGMRVLYRDLNNSFSFSPRLQYVYRPEWKNDVVLKLATGVYRQLPIYRELRNPDGNLNKQLDMQSSLHLIAGADYSLTIWNRPFKFISEAYYKYLWDVNPYDVNNIRVRYFGTNTATAYAYGGDFRLSGEFIENTESWFSLGILSTRENVEGDGEGYIRRPMDQRATLSIFFQDHLPNNPTFRVNVHVQIGSGLPFGPPDNLENRNSFRGDAYRRVDIGFSKIFNDWKKVKEFTIAAEILNLTGSENVISYTWIEDVYDQQFAVPNSLSARFLNIKLSVSI